MSVQDNYSVKVSGKINTASKMMNCRRVDILLLGVQGVFKKRPNFCYKDCIAHFTAF